MVELYLQCEQDTIAARARIDLIDQARFSATDKPSSTTHHGLCLANLQVARLRVWTVTGQDAGRADDGGAVL